MKDWHIAEEFMRLKSPSYLKTEVGSSKFDPAFFRGK